MAAPPGLAGARRRLLGRGIEFARTKPLGVVGMLIVALLLLAAIFAPLISPHEPLAQDYEHTLEGPGSRYLLGTDRFGRDILSRIIHGSKTSVMVVAGAVGLGSFTGLFLGLASGLYRGKFDMLVQRIVDALMAFPAIMFAMVTVTVLGASLVNVIIAVGLVFIPSSTRVMRSASLAVSSTDYVAASIALGATNRRILITHILPNTLAPYLILVTAEGASVILAEASLSFLGFGPPPPNPSWGAILAQGREFISSAWWIAVFPGMAISIVIYGFSLLGDALRDVLDPRLRGT